ncbi:MAG: penicillin-binding protein activator [Ketobacter sp.]|nr:MAG: penicillin-binding protein activator [Ketobacter sp.]
MKFIRRAQLNTLAAFLMALILSACETTGVGTGGSTQVASNPAATIKSLIERSQNAPSPEAEQLLIQAAQLLLDQGKAEEAKRLLGAVNATALDSDTLASLVLTLTDIHLALNEPLQAEELITTDRMGLLTASNDLNSDRLNEISLKRAQVWEINGNYLAAARERIFVGPMLETDAANTNQQMIWNDLIALPNDSLQALAQTVAVPEFQGWLELAWIYKGYQDQLDQQLQQLDQWQLRYPGHTAATQLPEALRLVRELSENQPQNIALLLPTQGRFRPAAEAILHGFMSAHYASLQDRENTESNISIRVYDTSDLKQFTATYQQAVADGADIIIGPLQKENLRSLLNSTDPLPVATIALNQELGPFEVPVNLYQFGLSPEDDALEVARRALQKQYHNAAVMFQNNPWWERAYLAFAEQWQQEKGRVTGIASYDDQSNMANGIKDMLLVQHSELRAKQLRNILGKNIEFQPRRRQDIDFIYLIATPDQARQIRPLLDFYYAEAIPVLAGSQIFSGKANPKTDRDLNGIEFCDIPWLLEKPDAIQQALKQAWPTADHRYSRLNAMGVDAYRLQSRLQLLTQIPDAGLFGATGNLNIGIDNRVQRELSWAVIKNGRPELLPRITETELEDRPQQTEGPDARPPKNAQATDRQETDRQPG